MAGSLVDLSDADDGGEVTNLGAGAIPDGSEDDVSNAGAAPSASPHGDVLKSALSTVQSSLDYGRQKYGLGNAGAPKPASFAPYEGMHQSTNIDDRRGDTAEPTERRRTKFDDLVEGVSDRFSEYRAGSNPLSQAAGFNDIASAKGAIPDEGETE